MGDSIMSSDEIINELNAENEELKEYISNIAGLIHYQVHLKHQDEWLNKMVIMGLYKLNGDDE
tara:strand:- start:1103 stop:1291 length:189 start_codon:yes stop_codon:yes gene_type:complete